MKTQEVLEVRRVKGSRRVWQVISPLKARPFATAPGKELAVGLAEARLSVRAGGLILVLNEADEVADSFWVAPRGVSGWRPAEG
jgi:hypothetical protein